MKKSLSRISVAVVIACAGCIGVGLTSHSVKAQAQPQNTQVAAVDELKSEAFKAIRGGQFDKSSELLTKAASLSPDPSVAQMAKWATQFESQQQVFEAERHKQYEKAVSDVHLLLEHNQPDFAMDEAAKAYLLASDKKSFTDEHWVADLIKASSAQADRYEESEQFLKAIRIYSDLGSVEPSNPVWKDKLKDATRRIRLLMLYTPDQFKQLQQSESKARETADALLRPATTQPATQPMAQKDEDNNDFKIDWHDTVRGAKYDMLWDALVYADKNYWRDIKFSDMIKGGLSGLKLLVTTHGLDRTFPGLADEAKRSAFTDALNQGLDDVKSAAGASSDDQERQLEQTLDKVRQVNHDTVGLPDEVFVTEFADGAFATLDPFSSMIWPYDVEEFNKSTQGEFSGVGIQIQSDDDGSLKVVSPLEDTPAYKAGIKAGDIITHIDGKNAKGISLNQAVKSITGPQNTTVTLTIRSPDGVVKDYPIQRETIKVASVKGYVHKPGGGWDYFVDPDNKVAYIRLTNFTRSSGDELNEAVDELAKQGAKGLVLDLRYNPGGLLTAATDVADKFLSNGVIVSTRADRETPNQPTVAAAKPDDDDSQLPLVVLVNQYSASASEIVSGALKDDHRAIIVGERTFGKGSVQMLFPLDMKKAYLKLTTSHYYLPSGKCIHREENSTDWGVDPDVTVEMTPEQMRAAIDARQELDVLRDANGGKPQAKPKKDLLASDPQLSAALLVLRIELAGGQL